MSKKDKNEEETFAYRTKEGLEDKINFNTPLSAVDPEEDKITFVVSDLDKCATSMVSILETDIGRYEKKPPYKTFKWDGTYDIKLFHGFEEVEDFTLYQKTTVIPMTAHMIFPFKYRRLENKEPYRDLISYGAACWELKLYLNKTWEPVADVVERRYLHSNRPFNVTKLEYTQFSSSKDKGDEEKANNPLLDLDIYVTEIPYDEDLWIIDTPHVC